MKHTEFQKQCLRVIEQVKRTKKSVVITKRKVPIVQIVPIKKTEPLFGKLKGSVHYLGNIIESIDVEFNEN